MWNIEAIGLIILAIATCIAQEQTTSDEEAKAWKYILDMDEFMKHKYHEDTLASWTYDSNLTDANKDAWLKIGLEISQLEKDYWNTTIKYDWKNFKNETLKRLFKIYTGLGTSALSDEQFTAFTNYVTAMESNYAKATICDYKNKTKCDLAIDPDITELFAKSQDPEELKYLWVEWHKVAGARVKNNFTDYVNMYNEAAKINNYTNVAEWWTLNYEVDNFEDQLAKLTEAIKPLYQQMHAYVRKRLRDKYGDKVVSARGPIPAHLLGNMWAQRWNNIESFTRPYPNKTTIDVTDAMKEQNYTALKMFQMADQFYQSLNMTPMPETFWKNSIIEKPKDIEMVCQASAWDFHDGEDFRIKQCTEINSENFERIHHEMGHIEYYLQYRNQPFAFQGGANPGFHEAIGDTIALSVTSPKHLRRVGLLKEGQNDAETEINQLYTMCLDKIALLPFAYLLDLFRYGVFRGTTKPEDYNCHYWRLREQLQGVEPPVDRTENDFDPAAKYHVSADVEFARYYVANIIQFQFHRALCQHAGEYVPNDANKKLVDCDIYNSTEAGNVLSRMLQLGSSRPWPDAMEILTGQREMSADGILEYFKPLQEWLTEENKKTGEFIGWESSRTQYCTADQLASLKTSSQNSSDASKETQSTNATQ